MRRARCAAARLREVAYAASLPAATCAMSRVEAEFAARVDDVLLCYYALMMMRSEERHAARHVTRAKMMRELRQRCLCPRYARARPPRTRCYAGDVLMLYTVAHVVQSSSRSSAHDIRELSGGRGVACRESACVSADMSRCAECDEGA